LKFLPPQIAFAIKCQPSNGSAAKQSISCLLINDMGLGLGILSAKTEVTNARSVGSYTWSGFFTTTFWIDREKDVIAILMLQMYLFEHLQINEVFETTVYQGVTDK
jgi:CubicO group peptidase (beta-lactamase class C family)